MYLTDITRSYSDVLNKKRTIQPTECEYKQRKAYCHFRNNIVGEIFINNLNSDSKYTLLKLELKT